ncbi:HET domain-containing protein [Ophiostoma piceae UAMH 11346]|uniref:HET domain-containing protein n=1 Tax=Ophiostoma piceae (strain UAMH 11346) TaxID=1262450 RepID=S3BWP8_OPHP1|nr:HET domain-containing protein [Ophiostoma piceae UAMH 11346]
MAIPNPFRARHRGTLRQLWERVQNIARWKRSKPVDAAFLYTPLSDAKAEIRLLTLLAGDAGDPVKIIVWHSELVHPAVEIDNDRATMAEVRALLPPGWAAAENSEGRFLFEYESTEKTTWSHPNPDFDQSRLRQRTQLPPLNFSPSFEAVSYVWGSADNPVSIDVAFSPSGKPCLNDDFTRLTWKHLSVRRNLYDALNYLRLQDQTRVLWIDAICVNQANDAEKSDQIVRMADIYNLAFRVLSWLGPESSDDNSDLAISTLTYISQQVEAVGNGGTYETPNAKESRWFSPYAVFPYKAKEWTAIEALLSRPYFERVWVLQEVAGANDKATAICGRSSMSWYHFKGAIMTLLNNNTIPPSVRELAESLIHLVIRPSIIPIPDLFTMSRMRKCTDPRDKIYGILGMAPREFVLEMRPHYTKSIEFIYAHAVMTYAKMKHSLVLIQLCQISQRDPSARNLPSWIPDFSKPEQTWPVGSYMHASGHSRAHFQFSDDGKTLTVSGKRLAVVKSVNSKVTSTVNIQDAIDTVRAWMPPDILTAAYTAGGSLLDAFLLMLRCSYLNDRWPMLHETTLAQWREYFLDHIHGDTVSQETHTGQVYTTASFIKNRVFVTAGDGHIGLAPLGTKPGDIITTVLGCSTCILLRPVGNGSAFQIVGQGYVQGLDDGSGLVGSLPEGWTLSFKFRDSGSLKRYYVNASTGQETMDNPRLGPLPAVWSMVARDDEDANPDTITYLNQESGETLIGDPRLSPELLRQRGISVESFAII